MGVLKDRIEAYLTSPGKVIDEELLKRAERAAGNAFRRQFMEDRVTKPKLTGSLPGPCARKMAYKYLDFQPSDDLEARSMNTFLTGDLLEISLVVLVNLSGVKVSHTCLDEEGQLEGLFDVGNGVFVPSHPDGIIEIQDGFEERTLLEIKTTSDFGFKREWLKDKVSEQYMLQHQVYMETFGTNRGVFLVQNKNTGHIHDVATQKDPEMLEWARNNYKVASQSDPDNLPERYQDGENYGLKIVKGEQTNRLAWGCTYCSYTHHCWPDVEVTFDKGKPVHSVPLEGLSLPMINNSNWLDL